METSQRSREDIVSNSTGENGNEIQTMERLSRIENLTTDEINNLSATEIHRTITEMLALGLIERVSDEEISNPENRTYEGFVRSADDNLANREAVVSLADGRLVFTDGSGNFYTYSREHFTYNETEQDLDGNEIIVNRISPEDAKTLIELQEIFVSLEARINDLPVRGGNFEAIIAKMQELERDRNLVENFDSPVDYETYIQEIDESLERMEQEEREASVEKERIIGESIHKIFLEMRGLKTKSELTQMASRILDLDNVDQADFDRLREFWEANFDKVIEDDTLSLEEIEGNDLTFEETKKLAIEALIIKKTAEHQPQPITDIREYRRLMSSESLSHEDLALYLDKNDIQDYYRAIYFEYWGENQAEEGSEDRGNLRQAILSSYTEKAKRSIYARRYNMHEATEEELEKARLEFENLYFDRNGRQPSDEELDEFNRTYQDRLHRGQDISLGIEDSVDNQDIDIEFLVGYEMQALINNPRPSIFEISQFLTKEQFDGLQSALYEQGQSRYFDERGLAENDIGENTYSFYYNLAVENIRSNEHLLVSNLAEESYEGTENAPGFGTLMRGAMRSCDSSLSLIGQTGKLSLRERWGLGRERRAEWEEERKKAEELEKRRSVMKKVETDYLRERGEAISRTLRLEQKIGELQRNLDRYGEIDPVQRRVILRELRSIDLQNRRVRLNLKNSLNELYQSEEYFKSEVDERARQTGKSATEVLAEILDNSIANEPGFTRPSEIDTEEYREMLGTSVEEEVTRLLQYLEAGNYSEDESDDIEGTREQFDYTLINNSDYRFNNDPRGLFEAEINFITDSLGRRGFTEEEIERVNQYRRENNYFYTKQRRDEFISSFVGPLTDEDRVILDFELNNYIIDEASAIRGLIEVGKTAKEKITKAELDYIQNELGRELTEEERDNYETLREDLNRRNEFLQSLGLDMSLDRLQSLNNIGNEGIPDNSYLVTRLTDKNKAREFRRIEPVIAELVRREVLNETGQFAPIHMAVRNGPFSEESFELMREFVSDNIAGLFQRKGENCMLGALLRRELSEETRSGNIMNVSKMIALLEEQENYQRYDMATDAEIRIGIQKTANRERWRQRFEDLVRTVSNNNPNSEEFRNVGAGRVIEDGRSAFSGGYRAALTAGNGVMIGFDSLRYFGNTVAEGYNSLIKNALFKNNDEFTNRIHSRRERRGELAGENDRRRERIEELARRR